MSAGSPCTSTASKKRRSRRDDLRVAAGLLRGDEDIAHRAGDARRACSAAWIASSSGMSSKANCRRPNGKSSIRTTSGSMLAIEVEQGVAPRAPSRPRRPGWPFSSRSVEKSSFGDRRGRQLRDVHAAKRNLGERAAAVGDRHVEPRRRHRLGQDFGAPQMADRRADAGRRRARAASRRGSSGMLSSSTDGVPSGAIVESDARARRAASAAASPVMSSRSPAHRARAARPCA